MDDYAEDFARMALGCRYAGVLLVLRRYSQDKNVKLRDVAERLIETRRLPAG